jgi:hypothetical protein
MEKQKKSRKGRARAKPKAPEAAEKTESSRRYVRDVLVRGEAAEPDEEGNLPTDATHVITGDENAEGEVTIKRVRYKTF